MKTESLRDQMITAVKESRLSQKRLANRARIPQSSLSRFLAGKQSLTLDGFCRLSNAIGLQLTKVPGR